LLRYLRRGLRWDLRQVLWMNLFCYIVIGFAPNETFLLYWYIMEAKVEFGGNRFCSKPIFCYIGTLWKQNRD
jgi:hypothetical protein